MIYVCSSVSWVGFMAKRTPFVRPGLNYTGVGGAAGVAWPEGSGTFTAIDATSGKTVWQKTFPEPCYSGTATTAGNLVFIGRNARPAPGLQRHQRRPASGASRPAPARTTPPRSSSRTASSTSPSSPAATRSPPPPTATTSGSSPSTAPSAPPPRPARAQAPSTQARAARRTHTTAGNAAAGKTVFADNCVSCHGALGLGGNGGPDLTGIPSAKNYNTVVTQVQNGGGGMPAFKGQLTAQADRRRRRPTSRRRSRTRTSDAPAARCCSPPRSSAAALGRSGAAATTQPSLIVPIKVSLTPHAVTLSAKRVNRGYYVEFGVRNTTAARRVFSVAGRTIAVPPRKLRLLAIKFERARHVHVRQPRRRAPRSAARSASADDGEHRPRGEDERLERHGRRAACRAPARAAAARGRSRRAPAGAPARGAHQHVEDVVAEEAARVARRRRRECPAACSAATSSSTGRSTRRRAARPGRSRCRSRVAASLSTRRPLVEVVREALDRDAGTAVGLAEADDDVGLGLANRARAARLRRARKLTGSSAFATPPSSASTSCCDGVDRSRRTARSR